MIHTIGNLLDALEKFHPDFEVMFEFGHLRPTDIASWRGDYSMAALGYAVYSGDAPSTVETLMFALNRSIDGRSHTGYKGEEYTFNRDTQLWVDNYGDGSHTRITKVHLRYEMVVLRCKWKDY